MKKTMFAFLPWLFFGFGYKAIAQEDATKNDRKEAEEIIIRKKGSKDVNLNIEIKDDKILINGKPLVEFKDDEITVNKKKIIVRDGNRLIVGDIGDGFDQKKLNWNIDGSVSKAFLGVSTEKSTDGIKITKEVLKETAAGKAGLRKGDIITKLDDTKIDDPASLYDAVSAKNPNDEVNIYYKRNGKEKSVKVTLQERKSTFTKSYSYHGPDGSFKTFTMPAVPPPPPAAPGWNGNDYNQYLAPEIQDELGDLQMNLPGFPHRPKLGLKIQDTEEGNGVKILDVEDSSLAAIAGLKKDDTITEIAGEKISNTDEAREQLRENTEKASYPVKVRRNGNEMNFTIKVPKKLKTANL